MMSTTKSLFFILFYAIFPMLSYVILFYPILSYFILFYTILSYFIIFFPI